MAKKSRTVPATRAANSNKENPGNPVVSEKANGKKRAATPEQSDSDEEIVLRPTFLRKKRKIASPGSSEDEGPPVGSDSEEEEKEEEEIDIDQRHRNLIAMYKPLAENILRGNLAREAAQQVTIAAEQAILADKLALATTEQAILADKLALATTEQAILADRLKLEEKLQKNRRPEIDMETLRESFLQLESNPDILDRKMKILEIQLRKMDSDNKSKELEIELLRLNNL